MPNLILRLIDNVNVVVLNEFFFIVIDRVYNHAGKKKNERQSNVSWVDKIFFNVYNISKKVCFSYTTPIAMHIISLLWSRFECNNTIYTLMALSSLNISFLNCI
jgi:hypothetical protein